MSRSPVWPFVTLLLGFALGALTVWALRDDTPFDANDAIEGSATGRSAQRPSSNGGTVASKDGRPAATGTTDSVTSNGTSDDTLRDSRRDASAATDRKSTARARTGDASRRESAGADDPDRADSRGAKSSKPASTSPTDAPVAPAAPLAVVVREAPGVVVDAATQLPIAGARVLLAIADGSRAGAWFGDTSDASGRFAPRVGDDTDLRGSRVELRVSKDGYEPSTTAVVGADPVRVELRARGAPRLPGRVTGTLTFGATTDSIPSEVEVDGYDEQGNNASQRAPVDARGAFALEGVPAGRWRLARGGGNPVVVDVPDGGEARVELAPPRPAGQGGFTVTDIDVNAVKPADPARAARLDVLIDMLARLGSAASPALDDPARARLQLAVAQEVQRLDAEDRAALPRRIVTVTGLAARIEGGARAWVRLEPKPRLFWRVEATAGAAQFPAVPIGTYTAVLVQPGRADQSCEVVVPPGDGPFVAEWK
ncbi:MAG: carboxypeptidase-like regulatory domain-containing protein [Planctomycetes bacterium]|nr:carboxypeptidase-like regulatory domain-containing protein [Planctomycetota bacterium]